MRSHSIFIKYIHQSRGILHKIQYKSIIHQYHRHTFCNESTKIKEISLDELLSSANLEDAPQIETESNTTDIKHKAKPIILEDDTIQDTQDIDDEFSEDEEIDSIIDEIEAEQENESNLESSSSLIPTNNEQLQKYNDYLPSIPDTITHQSFKSMGLRKKLERNLCTVHGLSPLPIQSVSFDKIMSFKQQYTISGSIIESGMGTGKTLAYLLPIMNDLKPLQSGQVIIVVPTNELGIQIKAMIKSYLINHEDYKQQHRSSSYLSNNQDNRDKSKKNKQWNLQHAVMNCNSNESLDYNIDYINKLSPCVIIGTPKRIRELFLYSIIKPSKINYIVFDEIDTLFPIKSKYEHKKKSNQKKVTHSHLKPAQLILNGIIKQQGNDDGDDNKHKCHAMFVGATIPNQLKAYIHQILQPYPVQLISSYKSPELLAFNNTEQNANVGLRFISPNITHQYIAVNDAKDKPYIISELIGTIRSDPKRKKMYNPAVLIFLGKDASPIQFAEALSEYDIKCALLHEYINDKTMRSKFLKLFKNGDIDAVIATESVCRGLDFIWLDHVIIAQIPNQDTSYLHISGRASRLGSKGFVTSVVDEYDEEQLKRHCFKYQIELTELDDKLKIDALSKQKRKYNKLNTFPLLLQSSEYQKKLKKQLFLAKSDKNDTMSLTDDQCL